MRAASGGHIRFEKILKNLESFEKLNDAYNYNIDAYVCNLTDGTNYCVHEKS